MKSKSIINLPWVEKYRPQTLEHLISHNSIINTIKEFIRTDSLPHLLFYGPPGTGKTSTMIACAKDMFGNRYKMNVLELNASDERGISTVRDVIKSFCETRSPFDSSANSKKIVILDEADSMTKEAQNALRRIIEKFSRTVRFCLICNYVSKIIPALVSRCTRFKFKKIPMEDSLNRVNGICQEESINITEEAIKDIILLCDGDMRKIVNMLQSVSITCKAKEMEEMRDQDKVLVDRDFVYKMSGYPHPKDIEEIFYILMNDNIKEGYNKIRKVQVQKGISMNGIIKEVSERVMEWDMPGSLQGNILQRLGEVEYRLSISCSEEVQLGSMVAAFTESRIMEN